jgi:hypothetical protein
MRGEMIFKKTPLTLTDETDETWFCQGGEFGEIRVHASSSRNGRGRRGRNDARIDAVSGFRTTSLDAWANDRGREVVEVREQIEAGLDLLDLTKPGPAVAADVPGAEVILQGTVGDVFQDRLCCRQLALAASAIDAPRVAFEILDEGERSKQRLKRHRTLAGIREIVDERKHGNELAIFGEMAFEHRRKFTASQPLLKVLAPCEKLGRCCLIEAQERYLIERPFLRPELERRVGVEPAPLSSQTFRR